MTGATVVPIPAAALAAALETNANSASPGSSTTASASAADDDEDTGTITHPPLLGYTPKYCFKWTASFVDSGLSVGSATEDAANGPANSLQQLPAAYTWFRLFSNHSGEKTLLKEGPLDEHGCYDSHVYGPESVFPAVARGHIFFELQTYFEGSNGDRWHLGSVPTGKKSADGVFSLEAKAPVYYFVQYPIDDSAWGETPGWMIPPPLTQLTSPEHNDMTRVASVISQVLRTPDNGTKPAAEYLVLADDGCPSPSLVTDSCVSDGVTYVGPAAGGLPSQSHWKYIVAHEIGHMVQGKFMGTLALAYTFLDDGQVLNDPPGTPPFCRCDHVTVANQLHCLQSIERISPAQVEGYAQFYASRIWNEAADDDCVFGYYKEFLDKTCPAGATCTPIGSDWSISPPVPVSCNQPIKWRNRECPTPTFGTEYDWMGFLYDVNTNAAAKLSMVELFGVYNQACGGNCNNVVVTWDDLSQAVEDLYGLGDARTLRFQDSSDAYGVGTDLSP